MSVGHQGLRHLVDLFGLLTLATTLREDYVADDIFLNVGHVALVADQTGFLRVLQIIAVALANFSVDSLLDPHHFVDHLVPELLKQTKRIAVFGIDDPNEKEALRLQFVEGDVEDLLIVQRVIGNGHSSRGVGRRQLPWRVRRDDVEQSASVLLLALFKRLKIKGLHVCRQGDAPKLPDVFVALQQLGLV